MKYISIIVALILTALPLLAQEGAFRLPEIPDELTSPTDRANYKAQHYWDLYNFNDHTLIENEAISEQGFIDFINTISQATEKIEAFDILASRLTNNNKMLDYFIDMADRHLAEPLSPIYNEELYIMMLESIVTNGEFEPIKLQQVEYYLTMAQTNRIGSVAADIELLLRDGTYCNLSDIHGTHILLYFGDPDCNVCEEAKEQLLSSDVIATRVATHQLTIVSVCIEGKSDMWLSTPAPCQWIDACDESQIIFEEETYEIARTPSFYLLDSDHRVVLRDVHAGYVIDYLQTL